MNIVIRFAGRSVIILFAFLLISCSGSPPTASTSISPTATTELFSIQGEATSTPFHPEMATPVPSPTAAPDISVWIDPSLPKEFVDRLSIPSTVRQSDDPNDALFSIRAYAGGTQESSPLSSVEWVYTLVAPFPTITDGVSGDELRKAWQGVGEGPLEGKTILTDQETLSVLESVFGVADPATVHILPADQLSAEAWASGTSWAIVPFEGLEPRWKVLTIDGTSPVRNDFDPEKYPLLVEFGLYGPVDWLASLTEVETAGSGTSILPASNRDPSKMTVLLMTGVTAMVRATAHKMDTLGVTYPGRDIRDILREADLTHISNEVSFAPDCPPGDPVTSSLQFCSDPTYLSLLEDVGADIIELSGNHMNDWGTEAMAYSLDLYRQQNYLTFAGGMNLEEARNPLLINHNGNKLAFIGCNPPGPQYVWATDTQPGAAPCDYDWMASEIQRLRSDGYLPVVTFQYYESYYEVPGPKQQQDFQAVADAGASIVSGSQAHYPQAMEFSGNSFIHYGLGNLFFDQQNYLDANTGEIVVGTRWEFADRHIFYDGKHISTELLTFMLEDWSKPRPMTQDEREDLLELIFSASGW